MSDEVVEKCRLRAKHVPQFYVYAVMPGPAVAFMYQGNKDRALTVPVEGVEKRIATLYALCGVELEAENL